MPNGSQVYFGCRCIFPALSVYTNVRKFLYCLRATAPAIKYTCCCAVVLIHLKYLVLKQSL